MYSRHQWIILHFLGSLAWRTLSTGKKKSLDFSWIFCVVITRVQRNQSQAEIRGALRAHYLFEGIPSSVTNYKRERQTLGSIRVALLSSFSTVINRQNTPTNCSAGDWVQQIHFHLLPFIINPHCMLCDLLHLIGMAYSGALFYSCLPAATFKSGTNWKVAVLCWLLRERFGYRFSL